MKPYSYLLRLYIGGLLAASCCALNAGNPGSSGSNRVPTSRTPAKNSITRLRLESKIDVYQGILRFKTKSDFGKALLVIEQRQRTNAIVALPTGFVSMSRAFQETLAAESKFFAEYERGHKP